MAERLRIDEGLARALLAAQFPQWADLPITAVAVNGWDNKTFRLGDELSLRMPRHEAYAAQVEKEHRWLPVLAAGLSLPIPQPVGRGAPGPGYPLPWSVYRWLDGEPLAGAADDVQLALDLAAFLTALQALPAGEGPAAGVHNFFRGGPLSTYDAQTREAIARLDDAGQARAAQDVWDQALARAWDAPPVWVHGDVAAGNLLMRDGRLAAVIDFGCLGTGDPACDLVMAWTRFEGEARAQFRAAMGLDAQTWARARGWALWKALILATGVSQAAPAQVADARRVLGEVLGDG